MTSIDHSAPKIYVGENFEMGDTSGQVAVGENITQYQDCTFVHFDGTTFIGKSWLYDQGFKPAISPDNIFGREEEIEKIDFSFKENSSLAITGISGTGKSTLASMYVDKVEKMGKFAGIYWRKVDETTEFIDIVGSFFIAIGKPIKNLEMYKIITDQVNLFFRELNSAPYFLILDNLETILDPQTNKPLKPGFSEFIEKAKENADRSRFMFISWECPASERGIRPTFHTIGGLNQSAAIKLLRQRGLIEPDDELKKVITLSGGHPLALILLVQLIEEGANTLSGILDDDTLWIGEYGEVAENILNKVYEKRLDDDERKLLQYVSIYRKPVPSKAIVIVANDSYWTEDLVKKIGLRLTRKSLLHKSGENYWEESLVVNYAYGKLADTIERHKLAYQYYFSIPIPETRTSKGDVQSLIEAHYHACAAKEYNVAWHIVFDKNLHVDLDMWGDYKTLVDIFLGMLPDDPLRDKPLLNIDLHIIVLIQIGHASIYLFEFEKAIEYTQNALNIASKFNYKTNNHLALGNIGRAYRYLNEYEKAIEYYEKALDISKEKNDKRHEGVWLGEIGAIYIHLNKIECSIDCYKEALKISKEIKDKLNEGVWLGELGRAYQFLKEYKKAISYYVKALRISRERNDRHNEGTWLGNIGLCYFYLVKLEKAIKFCENGLEISHSVNDKRNEETIFLNLGLIYSFLQQFERTMGYYENALTISKEIGDKRLEGVIVGNIGLCQNLQDNFKDAIKYYKDALDISREVEDKRNEGATLAKLGLNYFSDGDFGNATNYFDMCLVIGNELNDSHIIAMCEEMLELINSSVTEQEISLE